MQWQALHGYDQSAHASGDPSGMTAHQLGSVRIALLRHDRATRRIGIGQRHETEGLAGPNDEFFRQSRKVQTALRSGHQIIEGKIPVRYAVEAIVCGRIETMSRRRGMAVDRKAGACTGRASERALIHSGSRIGRSEEHTSELQSLMRISYAVFCLKKK